MKSIPAATQDYIIRLVFRDSNPTARKIHRFMLIRWTLWLDGVEENAIPGYDVCPPDCGKGHPAGWTYRNFRALYSIAIARDVERLLGQANSRK